MIVPYLDSTFKANKNVSCSEMSKAYVSEGATSLRLLIDLLAKQYYLKRINRTVFLAVILSKMSPI